MIIFLWILLLVGFVILCAYGLAKKNKWLITTIITGVVILLGIQLYSFKQVSFPSFVETVALNWEVNLPEPTSQLQMVAARGGLQGDGDDYTIVEYSDKASVDKVNQSIPWMDQSESNEERVRGYIQSLHDKYELEEATAENLRILEQQLDNPYKYYTKELADGVSFAIFLWFPEEGKLYVLESNHQAIF